MALLRQRQIITLCVLFIAQFTRVVSRVDCAPRRSKYGSKPNDVQYNMKELYEVPEEIFKLKGGISNSEKEKFSLQGVVYFPPEMRHHIFSSDGSPNYRSLEQVAVCSGHLVGQDLQQKRPQFSYFACPVEPAEARQIRGFSDADIGSNYSAYCCNSHGKQFCCDLDEFYECFGVSKSTQLAIRIIIAIAGAVGALVFAFCIFLVICVCVISPRRRRKIHLLPKPPPPPPTPPTPEEQSGSSGAGADRFSHMFLVDQQPLLPPPPLYHSQAK